MKAQSNYVTAERSASCVRLMTAAQRSACLCLLLAISGQAHSAPQVDSLKVDSLKADSLKTPDSFPRFPAVEPADAEGTFVVQAGFEMQLIAAEPLVTDPVAMAIDEYGRALVVEMNDYPYTDAKTHVAWQDNKTDAAIGRVRLLEDTDGDGKYDKSTLFAEGLSWPSGIACYQGGVFVTATPDVWYLKDTDGDGRADTREQVFTGFRKYNVQAVMNNPIWGLDNKLYVAGSSNGGSVLQPGQSQSKPLVARGDFRFDPRTRELELQAGGARFGNAFDDWGNRFLCNIRNPAIHVVLDNRYLARNPNFAAPTAIFNIAEAGDQMPIFRISPIEPWRDLRGRQWSADPTKKLPRSELTGGGVFTSTSGINVVRGNAYPPEFRDQLLVAEVANNVIYRQTNQAAGNTFRAQRADQQVEFVASKDTWFRPVNLINAPDGTLHVLDMYREFIEHPWSIPDDIHARLDLTSGRDRGRIYRLAPPGFKVAQPARPGDLSSTELVPLLAHASSWWRETAQRLLVERGAPTDPTVSTQLQQLTRSTDARTVVHALWTLQGLSQLDDATIAAALTHPSDHVREQAVRLAEPRLKVNPALVKLVCDLAHSAEIRLRLQVALSLGGLDQPDTLEALSTIANSDAQDVWSRAALCTATPVVVPKLLRAMLETGGAEASKLMPLVEQLTQTVAAMNNPQLVLEIVQAGEQVQTQSVAPLDTALMDTVWRGLFQAVRRKGINLQDMFDSVKVEQAAQVSKWSTAAFDTIANEQATLEARNAAIARLTLGGSDTVLSQLGKLLDQSSNSALSVTLVQAVGTYKSVAATNLLIERLRLFTPTVRDEALTVLLARPERTQELLSAIENKRLPAGILGLPRKTQLLASTNPSIKSRAEVVLGSVDQARFKVIEKYKTGMPAAGRSGKGQELYRQHCASCHRISGMGIEIGPHMETVRNWDTDKLLINVLDPNRELAPQSMAYSIALTSGTAINGMIAEETASSLVVKRASVATETLLREDIESMTNTGLSLMPAGFEELLNPEQMADLFAFIRQ